MGDKKITIAIDGHSSTGKSTAAKQLASALGYVFVDSGAMYRAVSLFALSENMVNNNILDKQQLVESLNKVRIHFKYNPQTDKADVYLNDLNVETQIRTIEVSAVVSLIAEVSEVRAKLVFQQQELGKSKGVVMDGRDIGTVVFPDAELKVFMTAASDVRAQRRYTETMERGDQVSYEDVLQNVMERDRIDSSRADSPLVRAPDALLLDTSSMTREQQFELLKSWAMERIF
jgi:cytidylate kinase